MAKQKTYDGKTEYEYDEKDPGEVARVAALCDPPLDVQRARAKAAFEAAAPEAAKQAAQSVALGAGGLSAADLQGMIASAIADAMKAGGLPAQAHSQASIAEVKDALKPSDEATTPVAGSDKPVKGSKSDA